MSSAPPDVAAAKRKHVLGRRGFQVVAAIVATVLVTSGLGYAFVVRPAMAEEVLFQEASSPGPSPFSEPAVVRVKKVESLPKGAQKLAAQGPFGGSGELNICKVEKLITFLNANPDRRAAWLGVLNVKLQNFEKYVRSLSPVLLSTDIRVTNHGFRNGKAFSLQSILAKGTAVLVDLKGNLVVRCYCGNPLLAPKPISRARCTGCPAGYIPLPVCTEDCWEKTCKDCPDECVDYVVRPIEPPDDPPEFALTTRLSDLRDDPVVRASMDRSAPQIITVDIENPPARECVCIDANGNVYPIDEDGRIITSNDRSGVRIVPVDIENPPARECACVDEDGRIITSNDRSGVRIVPADIENPPQDGLAECVEQPQSDDGGGGGRPRGRDQQPTEEDDGTRIIVPDPGDDDNDGGVDDDDPPPAEPPKKNPCAASSRNHDTSDVVAADLPDDPPPDDPPPDDPPPDDPPPDDPPPEDPPPDPPKRGRDC